MSRVKRTLSSRILNDARKFTLKSLKRLRNRYPNHEGQSSLTAFSHFIQSHDLPNWVQDEMRQIGKAIDPALYPTQNFLQNCQRYTVPILDSPGQVYGSLLRDCNYDHYTHVFGLPWLKRGGADLVALYHIKSVAGLPRSRVLVVLTQPGNSPWLSRLPSSIDVLNISPYVRELSEEHISSIIARLLVQLKVDNLHIINSCHFWETIRRHGLAISQNTRIHVSLYCDDYDSEDRPVGYARQYLPDCYKYINYVFSDNSAFPKLLQDVYGYSPDLFRVLKTPVPALNFANARMRSQKRSVLWAGRLDRQKRPELLAEIATCLPDVEFAVYGEVMIDSNSQVVKTLKKLKNVVLMGPFDGSENLPFERHSLYLYTSRWDGLPNMVLHAAYSGIPIVASSVGGVGDAITNETGYPVSGAADSSSYAEVINHVLSNPTEAETKARAARNLVTTAHTEENFIRDLQAVPGYLEL